MGNPLFRRSQLGLQSDLATPATATLQLVNALNMKNTPDRKRREERRNSMGGSNVYDDLAKSSKGNYNGRCVIGELPYFLGANIGYYAPTNPDGSGTPYLRTYKQPLTSAELTAAPMKFLSAYHGDDNQALRNPGVFVPKLTISSQASAEWQIQSDLIGQAEEKSGVTFAALTNPANETIKNRLSKVYIDDTWAGLGGTRLIASAFGFTWTYNNGVEPDDTMDGDLDYIGVTYGEPSCTLELTIKWDAAAAAEYEDWLTAATRFVRIENTGSLIVNTAGTDYFNQIFIDGAYVITDFDSINNENKGTTYSKITMEAKEDVAGTNKVQVTVQNNAAAPA